uniref:Probable cytochrome P450 9f2 n=3 Tax=Culex pipiens TaxID=7175 RepID=A0A8D8JY63_CULPI
MLQVDLFTACAVGGIVLLVYHYVSKKFEYFLSKPIPCPKPTFMFGNTASMMLRTQDAKEKVQELYNSFPDAKIMGFYNLLKPAFIVRDPEVIKKIGVKDFDYFMEHTPIFSPSKTDADDDNSQSLFGNSLFALRGQKWRDMRATLSPAFTGSKMRHMFDLVAECGVSLKEFLLKESKTGKRMEYEMKDTFSRFGTDVIATVAFGLKVDSMREQDNEFFTKGKKMLDVKSPKVLIKFLTVVAFPWLARKLDIDLVDGKLATYFRGVLTGHMKQREAHGIVRNDMINILMEVQKGALRHNAEEHETKDAGFATVEESSVGKSTHSRVWTESELIAQCFLFFFAGFDTVSSGMSFLAYELALSPEVQDRLYQEIMETDQSLAGKPLNYDTLQKMEYLDMVVSEALRKWPPAVLSDRLCSKDYQYDDGQGTSFVIEKNRTIWIPTIAIHNDPKFYPNPDKFDPERFSPENRSKIVPGTYLPFGIGPRNCIGSRFALMELKSIMYYLVKEFSLEPTERTEVPLKLSRMAISLQSEKGIWLELKPRK